MYLWSGSAAVQSWLATKWRRFMMVQEIQYTGLQSLTVRDIAKYLPQDRMYPYWIASRGEIARELSSDPWVRSAAVKRCPDRWWGCVSISVKEEQPAYVAIIGGVAWLASSEGVFLGQVAESSLQTHFSDINHARIPIEVRYTLATQPSADAVRGSLQMVRDAVAVIEAQLQLRIRAVEVHPGGDFAVRFWGYPFEAVFDELGRSSARLTEEAKRLGAIVAAAGEGVSSIERIDLAFDRVAVIDKGGSAVLARRAPMP
ncbi:MAG: FtsQ-type POTRA domain-containing protein [Bdellovibrionota bacterium]|nr:MAG: FtsQ-type POTRA domain-containing protein [Bdellovibrionota bacterium]